MIVPIPLNRSQIPNSRTKVAVAETGLFSAITPTTMDRTPRISRSHHFLPNAIKASCGDEVFTVICSPVS